jgi:ubiquinone/menaquinone biosynthesis C-methylase UbiE
MDKKALNNFSNKFCQVEIPLKASINDYDNFSRVYDEIMGDDYAAILVAKYQKIIKTLFPKGKIRYLDLACGTGAFCRKLVKMCANRLDCFGIDLSAKQIEIAKKKATYARMNIKYTKGSILEIEYPKKIDVITVNFDSLNHIGALKDWATIFSKIHSALSPNGIFLFDINTQKRLAEDWNHAEIIVKKSMTYIQIASGTSYEKEILRRRLFLEVYQRKTPNVHNLIIEEIAPTKEKLFRMLKDAGFSKVKLNRFSHKNINKHIFMKNRLHVIAYR